MELLCSRVIIDGCDLAISFDDANVAIKCWTTSSTVIVMVKACHLVEVFTVIVHSLVASKQLLQYCDFKRGYNYYENLEPLKNDDSNFHH